MHDPTVRDTVAVVVGLFAALTLISFAVRWVRLPLSVALVSFGLLVAAVAPVRLTISPDVVLIALLPGLVFEAAFRLHLENLRRVVGRIVMLAIPGVLLIAAVVAVVLHFAAGMPLATAFVVGAIVSATDPVAVVASMREAAVPRQLATLVEAESLFNDGTGVLLFTVAVGSLSAGVDPAAELPLFVVAIIASLILGAAAGFLASRLTALVDDYLLELTLTGLLAYGTYLVADSLGQSGIIATVTAGIVLGSYGRRVGMSARTQQAVDVVWEFVAFVLTALVFLLIGLTSSFADLGAAAGPIAWGIIAIVAGRIVVVYGFLGGLRLLARRLPAPGSRTSEWAHIGRMPLGWLHVVFWSGLRGAVAFALALALPVDVPDRALVQGTIFGIVLFTLLVQGASARRVIKWAGIESVRSSQM
ncbi:MAG: cation:proton antiporter [Chloroflexota bacterium]|nr:cation:proton antiporter [Chloroflexota bacterium]